MSIQDITVPTLPESVTDATIVSWYKQVGHSVREGEKLVDLETDKVVLEVVATENGMLVEILKQDGAIVKAGEVLGRLDSTAAIVAPVSTSETSFGNVPPKTSPAVRKMAAEHGIDLAHIVHSSDRVTKADILKHLELESHQGSSTAQSMATSTSVNQSLFSDSRSEERVPMTRLRKRVAERLLSAQREHAILTTFNEINMQTVTEVRNKYKETFEKRQGIKLGFMSFFTKAVVAALQRFPVVNASTEGDDIIYHGYYDIGIAVSSPRGLVVPIVRDADSLSLADIEKAIADFGQRAKNGQLTMEELTGGTFSITNGGIFGSMMSTPILNPPQSAILGMHNIVDRPIAEQGQVVIRPIMYVALSYDHRLIDGRDAVQFLVAIKQAIEDPVRLLLDF